MDSHNSRHVRVVLIQTPKGLKVKINSEQATVGCNQDFPMQWELRAGAKVYR